MLIYSGLVKYHSWITSITNVGYIHMYIIFHLLTWKQGFKSYLHMNIQLTRFCKTLLTTKEFINEEQGRKYNFFQ